MLISGIQKFTLLDYPEHPACIMFTPGCNLRCGYCHNPEFVLPEEIQKIKSTFIPEQAILNFLESRRGLLYGVVISGGEPTLMPDLIPFMRTVKRRGFAIKLDTNGNRPDILQKVIDENIVDYVAMDLKTSLENYRELTGPCAYPEFIAKSISILKQNRVEYEFRSTLLQEIHTPEILERMAKLTDGAEKVYLQKFRPAVTLKPEFANHHPFSDEVMEDIAKQFRNYAKQVFVR